MKIVNKIVIYLIFNTLLFCFSIRNKSNPIVYPTHLFNY